MFDLMQHPSKHTWGTIGLVDAHVTISPANDKWSHYYCLHHNQLQVRNWWTIDCASKPTPDWSIMCVHVDSLIHFIECRLNMHRWWQSFCRSQMRTARWKKQCSAAHWDTQTHTRTLIATNNCNQQLQHSEVESVTVGVACWLVLWDHVRLCHCVSTYFLWSLFEISTKVAGSQ